MDTLFWLNVQIIDQGRDTSGLESFWKFKAWGLWKDWSIRGVCGVGGYWRILWFYDIRDDYILNIDKIVLYLCFLQLWGVWGVWGDLSLGIWWDVIVMSFINVLSEVSEVTWVWAVDEMW